MTAARTTTYAWIALSAITLLSWWLAPPHAGPVQPNAFLTVAVVALGLVKGRVIIRHFMEVRGAPRWLKMSTDAWLVVLWGGILAIALY